MTPQQRKPPPPFPLTVVTGFLGAGKTSLLNRLLRDPALGDSLVIINEFGEIGLDHLLVERVDGDMVLMTSGCLCCSIRGDLIATLEDLLRRRDNARIAPFQRVIIETTGLADPAPILQTVMAHPYLMLRFRLDGVITVVDAVNGGATLDVYEEAVKQTAMADRLVLTKTDLLPAANSAPANLQARLKSLNPGAALLDAAKGKATAAVLLDTGAYDPEQKIPDVQRWLNEEAFAAGPAEAPRHNHLHEEGWPDKHDVNRHGADIRAFCLRHEAPLQPSAFDLFVEMLRKAHGPKLLRVKGIVALSDDPSRPVLIQGVQHVFHPPLRLAAWPDGDQATRIVFILRSMEPAFVETFWRTLTSLAEPSFDTSFAAGLLAPPRGGFFT
jgi:G3E family GTPase